MRLKTLKLFVEVVRSGGFSQASRSVFATQSTISKAVRQLEDELGFELLDRAASPLKLTAAGDIAYRRALAMLAESDRLSAELDELRGLKRGELRLGLPLLGSETLFAPLFTRYRQRYPGVDIRLFEHGSKRLEENLLSGEIEFAGSLLPVQEAHFEWHEMWCEPLVALLPTGHPLARETQVCMRTLADTPFILFAEGFALNPILLDICRRRGFVPVEGARSGQVDFIVALVAAGLGVAFLPRMLARQHAHPGVQHVPLNEPDAEWRLALIWRRHSTLSPAAQAWLDLVKAQ